MADELQSLAEEALEAFWDVVVKRYPNARTGDLSPIAAMRLLFAAETAIQEWVERNDQDNHGKAN